MKKRVLSVFFIAGITICSEIFSQTVMTKGDYIYANYKYALGDNDSKTEARRIAFLEAKRLCLEKAGTYIESNTVIDNYRLTKDEIITFAGAIIQVEIISEDFIMVGDNLSLDMIVKAKIDIKSFAEKINQIKSNANLSDQIRQQQNQINALENKIRSFHDQLKYVNVDQAIDLKQERGKAFVELNELEKIKYEILSKSKLAVENIELGMTPEEVVRLIGEPRSKITYYAGSGLFQYNYGNVWAVFEGGVVSCLIKADFFNPSDTRSTYKLMDPNAIIK